MVGRSQSETFPHSQPASWLPRRGAGVAGRAPYQSATRRTRAAVTRFATIAAAVAAAHSLSACGGSGSESAAKAPTTSTSSTTTAVVQASALLSCLKDVGAQPRRSFDNELFAPLVIDKGFVASIDAWRGTTTYGDYDSIYLFIYKDRQALERARAQFDDPMGTFLINRWNVLWTWADTTRRPPDEQVESINGCLARAAESS